MHGTIIWELANA